MSNNKIYNTSSFSHGMLIPGEGNTYIPPIVDDSVIESTKYIPYDFAENKIKLIHNETVNLKEKYENRLNELTDYYKKYIEKLNSNYNKFIYDMKEKSEKYVMLTNKQAIVKENELTQDIKSKEQLIDELRDIAAENNKQYQIDMKTIKLKLKEVENNLSNTIISCSNDTIQSSCDYIMNKIISSIEINNYTAIENELLQNISNYKEQIDTLTNYYNDEINLKNNEIDSIKNDLFIKDECYKSILDMTSIIESDFHENLSGNHASIIETIHNNYKKFMNSLHSKYISNEVILKTLLSLDEIKYNKIIQNYISKCNNTEKLFQSSTQTINDLENQLELLQSYEKEKSNEYELLLSNNDIEISDINSYKSIINSLECEIILDKIIASIEYSQSVELKDEINQLDNQIVKIINNPIIYRTKNVEVQTNVDETMKVNETFVQSSKNSKIIQKDAETQSMESFDQSIFIDKKDIEIQSYNQTLSSKSLKLNNIESNEPFSKNNSKSFMDSDVDITSHTEFTKIKNENEIMRIEIEKLINSNNELEIKLQDSISEKLSYSNPNDIRHIESLEDLIYDLRNNVTKLTNDNNELVDKNNFILHQLENMANEKRTDLVKKYENEIVEYINTIKDLNIEITNYKSQSSQDKALIQELTDRVKYCEDELKQKDVIDIENSSSNKEKTLHIQLNKQRDIVVMKTKAATAGWDAAAMADEKLEIEIEKAYKKGLQEGRRQHDHDMKELNQAIELKENRLTDLVIKINELENKLRDTDNLISKYQLERDEARQELSDNIILFENIKESMKNTNTLNDSSNEQSNSDVTIGHTSDEYERLKDLLDQSQNEIIDLTNKLDDNENKLRLLQQKIDLYNQIISLQQKKQSELMENSKNNITINSINNNSNNVNKDNDDNDLIDAINNIKASLTRGTALWKSNKRDECYDMFMISCDTASKKLINYPDLKKLFIESIASAKSQVTGHNNLKPKAAMILKKSMEKFVPQAEVIANELKGKQNEKVQSNDDVIAQDDDEITSEIKDLTNQLDILTSLYSGTNNSSKVAEENEESKVTIDKDEAVPIKDNEIIKNDEDILSKRENTESGKEEKVDSESKKMENVQSDETNVEKVDMSKDNNENMIKNDENSNNNHNNEESKESSLLRRAKEAEDMVDKLKKQLALVLSVKSNNETNDNQKSNNISVDTLENRRLNRKIKELETQINQLKTNSNDTTIDKKQIIQIEKNYNKKILTIETNNKKEKLLLDNKIIKLEKLLEQKNNLFEPIVKERDILRNKLKDYNIIYDEVIKLRKVNDNYNTINKLLEDKTNEYTLLNENFKKEFNLRKKYKNELEDLKGAIRVFARCRPFADYEVEKNCKQVVQFKDESSLNLTTSRGDRPFEFDAVFDMVSTQEQVFLEAQRLVESFLDGFNVCIFAYGQTGSGKTFTMTGSPENPGLTPRAIKEMFVVMKERSHCTFNISTYFVEMYNDNLVDLYWSIDNKNTGVVRNNDGSLIEPPKLDIKLDNRKMVTITNVVTKSANTYEELMNLFELGNSERHVGATKMNATSSRSHAIFAIMVEIFDNTTKRNTYGKLSLVDLAGSERADKTGATGSTLKEAQSINKSLSALGNVIAALSEGEKHIPYRSNKLTQLMQDSLGGNAKTLMFVNFSPADYNVDETYSSLNYATRVKKIVNNANKQADSEEVSRLKILIKKLQAGQQVSLEEINGVNNNEKIPEENNDDNGENNDVDNNVNDENNDNEDNK